MNIVKTILLRWKESIVLTDENKEKLFQCIATVIDVDCKNNKSVKFTTPTLVKRAIEFSPNSVYTLYMKTCDEVFDIELTEQTEDDPAELIINAKDEEYDDLVFKINEFLASIEIVELMN